MSKPCNNYPQNNTNIILRFGIKAKTLKHAISSLNDQELNSSQVLSNVNISAHGFDVTAREKNTGIIIGSVFLRSSALIDFRFCPPRNHPSVRLTKIVNLSDISKNFTRVGCVHDDDVVTVFLTDEPSQLLFLFGNTATTMFSVELHEPDDEGEMLPKCKSTSTFSKDSYQKTIIG